MYIVLVVEPVVSVVLLLVTGIVVMLVMTVVFVSVTGTVEVIDPLVMIVEVIGQVVVLLSDFISVDLKHVFKSRSTEKSHSRYVYRARCGTCSLCGSTFGYRDRRYACYDSCLRFGNRHSLYGRSSRNSCRRDYRNQISGQTYSGAGSCLPGQVVVVIRTVLVV